MTFEDHAKLKAIALSWFNDLISQAAEPVINPETGQPATDPETGEIIYKEPVIASQEDIEEAIEEFEEAIANGTLTLYAAGDNSITITDASIYVKIDPSTNNAIQLTANGLFVQADEGFKTIQANTYADAIAAATASNVGQIIYVKQTTTEYIGEDDPETPEDDRERIVHEAGAYIVTGAGTVQKLAQSSSQGPSVDVLEAEVAALQADASIMAADISTLKADVSTLQNEAAPAKVAANDKILAKNANDELFTTLSIGYDSSTKMIYLYGKNDEVIGQGVDATDFIKDGMLDSAELYIKSADATPAPEEGEDTRTQEEKLAKGTYIKLEFNTDAGSDPIYVDVTTLIDAYYGGDGIAIDASNNISIDIADDSSMYLTFVNGKLSVAAMGQQLDDIITQIGNNQIITKVSVADDSSTLLDVSTNAQGETIIGFTQAAIDALNGVGALTASDITTDASTKGAIKVAGTTVKVGMADDLLTTEDLGWYISNENGTSHE